MKLTPACLVILLAYAITCLRSPVKARPHPDLSRSASNSDSKSDSSSWSQDSSSSSQDSSSSSQDSSTEDSNGGFDECSSSPCQNGGTCINVATNDYSCTCVDEFLGRNCEEFNECSSSPCQNGGTCIDATNDYSCTCVNGYFGRNCEEFDECSSSPCQNGGTCIVATNDYNCTCVDRYFGRNCEEVEPCQPDWVLYNGSCYNWTQTLNTWEGARNACLINGGHLVDILSQAEQDFVISQFNLLDVYNDFWIGLNDRGNETVFVWADTNEGLSFTSWSYGGTAPTNGDYRDCVYFFYKSNMVLDDNDGWYDDACSELRGYICEMEAVYN